MELIKQVEINIDYILNLIKEYHKDHIKNKEIITDINKAVNSSMVLRNKKDLIDRFIASLNKNALVDEEWREFIEKNKKEELEKIITEENLNSEETYKFIENAFKDGSIPTTGTAITKILPPISRFSKTGERTKKRENILDKLKVFFERFYDISGSNL